MRFEDRFTELENVRATFETLIPERAFRILQKDRHLGWGETEQDIHKRLCRIIHRHVKIELDRLVGTNDSQLATALPMLDNLNFVKKHVESGSVASVSETSHTNALFRQVIDIHTKYTDGTWEYYTDPKEYDIADGNIIETYSLNLEYIAALITTRMVLSKLNPSLPLVYAIGRVDTDIDHANHKLGFITEKYDGDLVHLWEHTGSIVYKDVIESVMVQVILSVAALHCAGGIVHLDIHGGNIVYRTRNEPYRFTLYSPAISCIDQCSDERDSARRQQGIKVATNGYEFAIIDFGLCSIAHGDKCFVPPGYVGKFKGNLTTVQKPEIGILIFILDQGLSIEDFIDNNKEIERENGPTFQELFKEPLWFNAEERKTQSALGVLKSFRSIAKFKVPSDYDFIHIKDYVFRNISPVNEDVFSTILGITLKSKLVERIESDPYEEVKEDQGYPIFGYSSDLFGDEDIASPDRPLAPSPTRWPPASASSRPCWPPVLAPKPGPLPTTLNSNSQTDPYQIRRANPSTGWWVLLGTLVVLLAVLAAAELWPIGKHDHTLRIAGGILTLIALLMAGLDKRWVLFGALTLLGGIQGTRAFLRTNANLTTILRISGAVLGIIGVAVLLKTRTDL